MDHLVPTFGHTLQAPPRVCLHLSLTTVLATMIPTILKWFVHQVAFKTAPTVNLVMMKVSTPWGFYTAQIHFGTESSVKVLRDGAAVILTAILHHGSVCNYLILPVMTLRCAYVGIKTHMMKTVQYHCWNSISSSIA